MCGLGAGVVINNESGVALIEAAQATVSNSRTVEEAIASLATILEGPIPSLARVSVRLLEDDGENIIVTGVWTSGQTTIRPGLVVRALATSFPELLRDDHAVVKTIRRADPALDDLLRREGVWSWVSIPLHRGGAVRGMLSISSREPDAFADEDVALFDRLGAVVEAKMMSLSSDWIEGMGHHTMD